MSREIFSELIEKPKSTRKWLFIPTSFVFHLLVFAALVVTPLMTSDVDFPEIKTFEVVMVAPNTLSMPVGRKGSPAGKGGKIKKEKKQVDKPAPVQTSRFTAPVEIPDEIKEEDISGLFPAAGEGDGLVDGALEGDINGVLGAPPGDGSQNVPIRLYRVEQVPRVIKKVKPVYPEVALKARAKGTVIIEAETDIYGRVIKTRVVSGNPLLVKAAEEAVRKWVYEPYIINGISKPVRFTVELKFMLTR